MWEDVSEAEFLTWVYTFIGDDSVDVMSEIDKRIRECKNFVGVVKICRDSEFYGIECLESETQFGFFKDNNDRRPSSCTWVDKEIAFKLCGLSIK